ncbi:exonuclease domain-containing protein [Marinibaculum pumilum]|uniref:Exonuclease domain-containing protein n=1 Tax=Marinibaculum pumilum TaxID=1766165 RepID=A0ABV7KXM4_9PROT
MTTALVVLDLEFTAWEGSQARKWNGPNEHREIVQIGAVRMSRDRSGESHFETLVRPVRNPVLSDYFTALTGIAQADLDRRGRSFRAAWEAFLAFAGGRPVWAWGRDGEVVAENLLLAGMPLTGMPAVHDLRPLMARLVPATAALSSGQLAAHFGGPAGRPHDALEDARSVARALRLLGLWPESPTEPPPRIAPAPRRP